MERPFTTAIQDDKHMSNTREVMADAIDAWGKEDPKNRNLIIIFGDEEGQFTSCGYAGNEVNIVGCVVNEMFEDENVARIITNAAKVYQEVLEEEREEAKKKENKPKKASKLYS